MIRRRPRVSFVLVLQCIALSLASSPAWAAPKAWLVNEDGGAVKLDLSQNIILKSANLPSGKILLDDLGSDPSRANLFVLYGRGPYEVAVLDLPTLAPKGRLDFKVNHAPTGEIVRFVFPPVGGEFFVRWWNKAAGGGTGAFEVSTVDATTLITTARLSSSPNLTEKLMLDPAGRRLYSMTDDMPAGIDVFDIPSFTRTSSTDLEAFLNPATFGRGIDDFAQGKILVVENEKTLRNEPDRLTLFVYDIGSGRVTTKIRTGMLGDTKLLPRTNRVLFDEKSLITPGAAMVRPGKDLVTVGKIHIFDVANGNRLATVQVNVDPGSKWGKILGMTPAEDTFYYLLPRPSESNLKLLVISLNSFSVVKELVLPIGVSKMVVFEE